MSPSPFNAATAREHLAAIRLGTAEPGIHDTDIHLDYDPTKIVELGTKLVATQSLDTIERLAVHEQVLIAALDAGDVPSATKQFQALQQQFPVKSSIRMQRLQGLIKEAEKDYAGAQAIYEAAVQEDETNVTIHKRLIGLLVSQGKRAEAIEKLVVYVDAFMQDVEGWAELASLYLAENLIPQAAFCLEEILVLRPQNHLYHIRYADVTYTLGKFDVALKHYCAALELCRDNTRALYGMRLASDAVLRSRAKDSASSSPATKRGKGGMVVVKEKDDGERDFVTEDTLQALKKLAGDRLVDVYERNGNSGTRSTTILKAWLQTGEQA
ncbi:uncharacterized protein EV422DRAFT_541640 [Fimicolochytrium jonesii]|uniref:uncharacterized protein n=1 Tax=Fimicolochytrium jonesii TaxID=1396493 RepID=UPI0022FDC55B|nr:uncharacterized protein EV422DRAFT_541640 [Fimicolochytrium jonesii]KAI8817397.1 hypothetical protein EV422DRAFT_541640 [Fimicolochytrium jonesii]